jgi:hypothetical protein
MWLSILNSAPTNGQTVWIRAPFFYSPPVQAVWNSSTQIFTTVVTSINFPAYVVPRWKA